MIVDIRAPAHIAEIHNVSIKKRSGSFRGGAKLVITSEYCAILLKVKIMIYRENQWDNTEEKVENAPTKRSPEREEKQHWLCA